MKQNKESHDTRTVPQSVDVEKYIAEASAKSNQGRFDDAATATVSGDARDQAREIVVAAFNEEFGIDGWREDRLEKDLIARIASAISPATTVSTSVTDAISLAVTIAEEAIRAIPQSRDTQALRTRLDKQLRSLPSIQSAPTTAIEADWRWFDRKLRAQGDTDLANRLREAFKSEIAASKRSREFFDAGFSKSAPTTATTEAPRVEAPQTCSKCGHDARWMHKGICGYFDIPVQSIRPTCGCVCVFPATAVPESQACVIDPRSSSWPKDYCKTHDRLISHCEVMKRLAAQGAVPDSAAEVNAEKVAREVVNAWAIETLKVDLDYVAEQMNEDFKDLRARIAAAITTASGDKNQNSGE